MAGKTEVLDKYGIPIHTKDVVRGGIREGEVGAIFIDSTTEPAEKITDVNISIKNPPKVVFTTQKGKQVAHNPEVLHHIERKE